MTPLVQPYYEDLAHQNRTGRFGLWVFIGSETLFFGALFSLYFGYRSMYPKDFLAASQYSNLTLGSINTYVLLTSSLCVALAIDSVKKSKPKRAMLLLVMTAILAIAFLALKFTEYMEHGESGILPGYLYDFPELPGVGALLFFTLYYGMTGLHAVHVIVGLGLFAWGFYRLARGRYTPDAYLGLDLVGLYWHFVDIIWLFLWPMFYLLH